MVSIIFPEKRGFADINDGKLLVRRLLWKNNLGDMVRALRLKTFVLYNITQQIGQAGRSLE